MKSLKPITVKRLGKKDRERKVLLGLIELYLETGKPVGSHTLKEEGFEDLSSATLRNYFAHLEETGYLRQQHSSGGRIPTDLALKLYANEYLNSTAIDKKDEELLRPLKYKEGRDIANYLQRAAEQLSHLTQTAVFLSAPRFDHDFIIDIKLVTIDTQRSLAVLITDFGVIKTEVLHTDGKLSSFSLRRMEAYFRWRLTGHDKPASITPEEEALSQQFYNELLVRYVVGYANFNDEEVYRTGFSRLLAYPEFNDASSLASGLSLFENHNSSRLLLRECNKHNTLKAWVGDDLAPFSSLKPNCAILAIPYRINQNPVGAIGLLGPARLPYRKLFGILRLFSEYISEALTQNIYKFKISFRQPQRDALYLEQHNPILLEDKRGKVASNR